MLSVVKVKQSALPRIQCYVVKAKVLLSVLSAVKVSGGGERIARSGRLIARWEWEHVQKEGGWAWEIKCAERGELGVGEHMDRRGLGVVLAHARPHLHGKHVPLVYWVYYGGRERLMCFAVALSDSGWG